MERWVDSMEVMEGWVWGSRGVGGVVEGWVESKKVVESSTKKICCFFALKSHNGPIFLSLLFILFYPFVAHCPHTWTVK